MGLAKQEGTSQSGIRYNIIPAPESEGALICIHGWACRRSDFDPMLEYLASKNVPFMTIAVDLPGHGETSKDTSQPTIAAFAEIVLEVAKELDLRRIILVGHSMGVRVALEAMQQAQQGGHHPLVTGIVFLDGSHYKLRKSLFAFDSGDVRSASLTSEEKAEKKAEVFRKMFSSNTPLAFQESTLQHVKMMDEAYSDSLRRSQLDFDYNRMDDLMDVLNRTEIPLLSFQSSDIDDQNQRMPIQEDKTPKFMQYIDERVAASRQIVVPESSHFPHVDFPKIVANQIIPFVQGY